MAITLPGPSGPVIELLQDERFFAQAFIDHGVLTWPNGYAAELLPALPAANGS